MARMCNTQQVYALKIMNKWDMLKRGEVKHFTYPLSFLYGLFDYAIISLNISLLSAFFLSLCTCLDSMLSGGKRGFAKRRSSLDNRVALCLPR